MKTFTKANIVVNDYCLRYGDFVFADFIPLPDFYQIW